MTRGNSNAGLIQFFCVFQRAITFLKFICHRRLCILIQMFPIYAIITSLALCAVLIHGEEPTGTVLPVLREHCIQCHGKDGKVKGKTNLLEIENLNQLSADPKLLQNIIDVIDFNEMPPEDEAPLPAERRQHFLKDLKLLQSSNLQAKDSRPHTPVRRMNRFQYNNAVIDLFDLNGVVFSLPENMMREHKNYFRPETGKMPDKVTVGSRPLGKSQLIERRLAGVAPFPQDLRAEHGFDNRGDHLSLSPLLLESFLKLGQSIVASHDFNPKNVGIWQWFFKAPAEAQDLEQEIHQRLEKFLYLAFRRQPEETLLKRYKNFVLDQLSESPSFEVAMKAASAAAISSPRFLYLYNESTDRSQHQDFDLASRLSFFLWGSIPDQRLLDLASEGSLSDPEVLNSEFERMLKDQKLKRFCDSFPSQWLQLERIISSVPNREKYPGFYFLKYRDSMHMMMEPLLIFETVLIENQPITQFLDSDFTYRSSLLQDAYGELALGEKPVKPRSEVTILNFERMKVEDRRSGGLITNAAVMTMNSGPERTKPITRGAWIASVIFNNPPEPPPADVPPLDEIPSQEDANLTLRERLAKHRERADCRGCHEKIDPLGFALENYDPIGNWRTHYENGRKVDMSGTLLREHDFGTIIEFKDALLKQKDRFTRALTGHILSFALARELDPMDSIALDQIAEATAKDDYKMQTLLKEIILSAPFRNQHN